jgi:ABC-type amino acid transport substrate-binding protein
LVVGIKEAPPFVIKLADGNWSGISIDLWTKIAADNRMSYRFAEEPTVKRLIDGVAAGKFDIGVAALTVTADRENLVDFTTPFYATGLGIAVRSGGLLSWTPVLRALTSFGFLQAVLALFGLALAVGVIVWLFERRHNEDFGGGVAKGLSYSVWWTTIAMTQRGIGNFGPRTLPGRAVAMFWMLGSIIAIAVFTAGITSAITVRHLQGEVHGVSDLTTVRVGAIPGTSTVDALARMRIKYTNFANVADGLRALRRGRIDAFVHDKPLLAWSVTREFQSSIQLLDTTFDAQHYAFALPSNSLLRKPVSIAILKTVESDWWAETLFRYLGSR